MHERLAEQSGFAAYALVSLLGALSLLYALQHEVQQLGRSYRELQRRDQALVALEELFQALPELGSSATEELQRGRLSVVSECRTVEGSGGVRVCRLQLHGEAPELAPLRQWVHGLGAFGTLR